MNPDRSVVVDRVFRQVLERLAFMFAERVEKGDAPPPEEGYRVGMSFRGPLSGALVLVAPREAAAELAANILGLDSDDPVALLRAEDALKELLNVTCGSLLTALAGDGPVFDLTVPESVALGDGDWEGVLEQGHSLAFRADDHPLLLCVALEGED